MSEAITGGAGVITCECRTIEDIPKRSGLVNAVLRILLAIVASAVAALAEGYFFPG